jgi:hypothetical protein
MADDKLHETEIAEQPAEQSVEETVDETVEPPADATDEAPAEDDPTEADATSAQEGEAEGPEADEPDGGLEELTADELEELRANEVAFSWEASEYVHHTKGMGWYAVLGVAVAVLVAIAALLHIWLYIATFLIMGAAIIVYARKAPRVLTYELTPKGIVIEGKQYPFADFRSFGVLKDEDWHTIDLEPMKRFAPRITVLFDSDDLDSILDHMELHLPRTDREPDLVERATRYLRF